MLTLTKFCILQQNYVCYNMISIYEFELIICCIRKKQTCFSNYAHPSHLMINMTQIAVRTELFVHLSENKRNNRPQSFTKKFYYKKNISVEKFNFWDRNNFTSEQITPILQTCQVDKVYELSSTSLFLKYRQNYS